MFKKPERNKKININQSTNSSINISEHKDKRL